MNSLAQTKFVIGTLFPVCLIVLHQPFAAVLTVLVSIAYQIYQARYYYGSLESCGIPVVKPTLFRGSEPNLHSSVKHLEDLQMFEKLGGVWGTYKGRYPRVIVCDPDLIHQMFSKDFDEYFDKPNVATGAPLMDEIIGFQSGKKWKLLRNSMTPFFTTSKLKRSSAIVASSLDELMKQWFYDCQKERKLKLDCGKRISAWLTDIVTRITLDMKMDDRMNPDNTYADAFRTMMGYYQEHTVLYSLSYSFPIICSFVPSLLHEPAQLLSSIIRKAIIQNANNPNKENSESYLNMLTGLWKQVGTKKFEEMKVEEMTVLSQAMSFYLAASDTTTTALTHLLWHMAERPEIQEKMHLELKEALKRSKNQIIDYDLVKDSGIPYTLACINETLRLAPSVYRYEHVCTKDWTDGNISIKKGMTVEVATWPANRHPKVCSVHPNEFIPERFLQENDEKVDPHSFATFGFGPRACVGTRFAYESMKLFVCHLIKNFHIEKRLDTQMNYKPAPIMFLSYLPLYVNIIPRIKG